MSPSCARARAGGDVQRSVHIELPLAERAPVLARRRIADVLRSWQLVDEDWTYDVLLVGSELVTNAVRHGGRQVGLALTLGDAELVVEVSDGSAVVPAPRDDADESGRGLAIVAAIAAEWGVRGHAGGKTVWARMHGPVPAVRRRADGHADGAVRAAAG